MASIGYRAGAWEVRYRDPVGKQRVERFPGPQGKKAPAYVIERLGAVSSELRRGEWVAPEAKRTTFAQIYEKWAASRQISKTKRYTDDGRAKKHVLPYWGHREIGEIRPSDIDDWIALLSTQMGPWSVRICYSLLRGPLHRAVKDRVIIDPCIGIVLPKKPEIRKTFDDVLTAVEVDRFVAALADVGEKHQTLRTNGRYAALVFMGAWLGPRWNEAIGVRICDLDMLRREATFGRVVVNQNGSHTFTEAGSKTGDWRTVPVPEPVIDALAEHIVRYVPDPSNREAFLFTNKYGRHPLRSNMAREFRDTLPRAGLAGRRVTWLTLRHTAASLMFDAGLSVFEVQQRLGHKDPTLTMRVYTHLMRERFDEGRVRLETYMAEKRDIASEMPVEQTRPPSGD